MNILIDPLLFLQFFREITGGIFNSFILTCTEFGETSVSIIFISAIYWCFNKRLGEYLLVSQAGADLLNGLEKITFCVYRPWILDSRIKPVPEAIKGATGYSFPSGHCTTATTLFGGTILRGKLSKPLTILLSICLALVMFSRAYLGVHTVIDVIFGFGLTMIFLLIVSKLFDKLEERPNLDLIIACAGSLLTIGVVIYALTKSYPMDYDAAGQLIVNPAKLTLDTFGNSGLAIGTLIFWVIERRFIKFSTDGNLETKVTRFIGGFIPLIFIIKVIMHIMPKNPFGSFLGQFVMVGFVILIYPSIIKYFQKKKKSQNNRQKLATKERESKTIIGYWQKRTNT